MIKKLDKPIKEPFWSAGQKYKWEGSRTGIGLNVVHFENIADDDILEVKVVMSNQEKKYQIKKGKAKELGNRYNSYFTAKDGTKLIVLPLHELTCLEENAKENATSINATNQI